MMASLSSPISSIRNKRKRGVLYATDRVVQSLECCHKLEGHKGCVNAINFNINGDLIVTGSDDQNVKIWNTWTGECLTTLGGHISNVFATNFLNNNEVISGGNDSDIRHFDIERNCCTVYQHHTKKVLKFAHSLFMPRCFYSCSADGTVRMFDVRCKYPGCKTENNSIITSANPSSGYDSYDDRVLPQAIGGGRQGSSNPSQNVQSLIVNYRSGEWNSRASPTLYSIDVHPLNPHQIIVGSYLGDSRLFDTRKIQNNSHESYVNVFRKVESGFQPRDYEVTGTAFSHNGTRIVHTHLGEQIYVFDTNRNFERDENVDYSTVRNTEENQPPQTYDMSIKGHCSSQTIKGVSFFGKDSEYIVSGSDDSNIFVWSSTTGELLRVLTGHDDIVNTVVSHPEFPILLSGGIDSYVNVWTPSSEGFWLTEEEKVKRKKEMEAIAEENEESLNTDMAHMPSHLLDILMQFFAAHASSEDDQDDEDEDI